MERYGTLSRVESDVEIIKLCSSMCLLVRAARIHIDSEGKARECWCISVESSSEISRILFLGGSFTDIPPHLSCPKTRTASFSFLLNISFPFFL